MKRLFCAVKVFPSAATQTMIDSLREGLQHEPIRWVAPENLHITLAFFGDVPAEVEGKIIQALRRASHLSAPFTFSLKGCGFFGSSRLPRVLWMGIDDDGALAGLHRKVCRAIGPLGFGPEKRGFSPHLTFARVKNVDDPSRLMALLDSCKGGCMGTVEVDRVYLFQSILKQEGPEYRVVAQFPLGPPAC